MNAQNSRVSHQLNGWVANTQIMGRFVNDWYSDAYKNDFIFAMEKPRKK